MSYHPSPYYLTAERACKTLGRIGPAVFYGGFSTFLALSPLFFAKVYALKTFFQVGIGSLPRK